MAVKKKFPARVACVYCNGGCHAEKKMEYQAANCEEAAALCDGGPLLCSYGCLGCGSCVQACKFDAIHINANGVAEVDEEKCIGCGACVRKCPRQIIHIRLQDNAIVPLCSNKSKGVDAKTGLGAMKVCSSSCIGCGACVRVCPAGAVEVIENCAQIDESRCLSCGACLEKCPRHVIVDKRGLL